MLFFLFAQVGDSWHPLIPTLPDFLHLQPNFANTVFDTLLELASGISEEELKYRIIFFDNPSNDDWATQNVRAQQNFFAGAISKLIFFPNHIRCAGKKKYDAQQRQRSQK